MSLQIVSEKPLEDNSIQVKSFGYEDPNVGYTLGADQFIKFILCLKS